MSWKGSIYFWAWGRFPREVGIHYWEHALSHNRYMDLWVGRKRVSIRFVWGGAGTAND